MGTRIESTAVVTGGLRRRHSARRLADTAARACLADAQMAPRSVDVLVNAGIYRDENLGEPALAALIQEDIGANPGDPPVGGRGTFSFDVSNGGCGVLTALQIIDGLLAAGTAERGLVVASDADPGRRIASEFPFGPTGAAALCTWDDAVDGFTGFRWKTFPEFEDLFVAEVRFEDARNVLEIEQAANFDACAATAATDVVGELLADQGVTIDAIDRVVASPPSERFLAALSTALAIPREKCVDAGPSDAHTAALLFALDALARDRPASTPPTVLFVAAGAGITVGAAIHRD
jgi:3-oxoacyl-[acyl-carrier-protein] synthase III